MRQNYHHLILIYLLATLQGASAQTVELREATEYFGRSRKALESVRRYETVFESGAHTYRGIFEARKLGKWSLILRPDVIGFDQPKAYSAQPLNVSEEQILGPAGLLSKCIDQFLTDMPGAKVDCVQIELRCSPTLWEAFLEKGRAQFKNRKGNFNDSKAIDQELGGILNNLLSQSSEAANLGQRIASKFKSRIYRIRTESELWEFHHRLKPGAPLSEIARNPTLGYTQPPVVKFYLEPFSSRREHLGGDK